MWTKNNKKNAWWIYTSRSLNAVVYVHAFDVWLLVTDLFAILSESGTLNVKKIEIPFGLDLFAEFAKIAQIIATNTCKYNVDRENRRRKFTRKFELEYISHRSTVRCNFSTSKPFTTAQK